MHRLGLARVAAISSYCAGIEWNSLRFAARGIFDSVQRIASNFRRSISVNSSSFFDRNAVGAGEHAVVERGLDVEHVHVLGRPARPGARPCVFSIDRFGSM